MLECMATTVCFQHCVFSAATAAQAAVTKRVPVLGHSVGVHGSVFSMATAAKGSTQWVA
jgi:hypothetical protein